MEKYSHGSFRPVYHAIGAQQSKTGATSAYPLHCFCRSNFSYAAHASTSLENRSVRVWEAKHFERDYDHAAVLNLYVLNAAVIFVSVPAAPMAVALGAMAVFFAYLIFGTRSWAADVRTFINPGRFSPQRSPSQLPYEKKRLLSDWERRALLSIRAQIPAGFYVCPQVRLIDMLLIAPVNDLHRQAAVGKTASKSVDFAIIELATGDVALVIELDDRTHDQPARRERDLFVNAVLQRAGIPLRRFRPDTPIHVRDFFNQMHAPAMKGIV